MTADTPTPAPPTLEEVERELAEIEAKLSERTALVRRKRVLLGYRVWLNAITGNASIPDRRFPQRRNEPTTKFVYETLKANGDMGFGKIRAALINQGWTSSGDARKDNQRIWQALHGRRDLFKNHFRGRWKLREDAKEQP